VGELTAFPRPPSGLRGTTSKREGMERGKEERKRNRRGGTGPLSQIPRSAPDYNYLLQTSYKVVYTIVENLTFKNNKIIGNKCTVTLNCLKLYNNTKLKSRNTV